MIDRLFSHTIHLYITKAVSINVLKCFKHYIDHVLYLNNVNDNDAQRLSSSLRLQYLNATGFMLWKIDISHCSHFIQLKKKKLENG